MKEVLDRLWELQQADTELRELAARSRELSEGTRGAQAAFDAAQAAADAEHHKTQEAMAAVHRHEIDLKGREDEIGKSKLALNKVSSNKEYQSLLLKIGTIQAECGKVEEEILLAMEAQEEQEQVEAGAKAEVEVAKAGLRAAEARVEEERGGLEARMQELAASRETLAAAVPDEQRRIYERILKGNSKSGTAITQVQGEYCQGCQMQITPQQYTDLVGRTKMVLCRTCQRILILDA